MKVKLFKSKATAISKFLQKFSSNNRAKYQISYKSNYFPLLSLVSVIQSVLKQFSTLMDHLKSIFEISDNNYHFFYSNLPLSWFILSIKLGKQCVYRSTCLLVICLWNSWSNYTSYHLNTFDIHCYEGYPSKSNFWQRRKCEVYLVCNLDVLIRSSCVFTWILCNNFKLFVESKRLVHCFEGYVRMHSDYDFWANSLTFLDYACIFMEVI